MTTTEIQYCEDCEHCILDDSEDKQRQLFYARCQKSPDIDEAMERVSKSYKQNYHFCTYERSDQEDTCENFSPK